MLTSRVTGSRHHELTGNFVPEQLLQAAVLADAIGDLKAYRDSRRQFAYYPAKSAWGWILTDGDRQYPFSFVGISESLGLDPVWLRAELGKFLTVPAETPAPASPTDQG